MKNVSHEVKYKIFRATAIAILFYRAQVWGYLSYEAVKKFLNFDEVISILNGEQSWALLYYYTLNASRYRARIVEENFEFIFFTLKEKVLTN